MKYYILLGLFVLLLLFGCLSSEDIVFDVLFFELYLDV